MIPMLCRCNGHIYVWHDQRLLELCTFYENHIYPYNFFDKDRGILMTIFSKFAFLQCVYINKLISYYLFTVKYP